MLYASETWWLRENAVSILRRTEIYGKSNAWRERDGQKEHCWIDEARIKRNYGKSSKSK